uniref:ATP synthase subunit delta, chloroplastic n=1 Tax=Scinaia undulata TaxID=1884664 RepID=A0A1G4NXG1_9FLOR|nr:ATP synthase CF1 subunit delta [Scinaia undulata]SCW23383.1 ATP synthase CF1 subunit delta [Scinaia undulata]
MSSKAIVSQLSLPYAEALLELAQKTDIVDKVSEDMRLIVQVLSESESLTSFLSNPLVSVSSKKEALQQLFSGQVSDSVLVFTLVLVDKKRVAYLKDIANRYFELLNALQSLLIVKVISSTELTDEQQNNLVEKLKQMTSNNQISLELSVDNTLIAGFTLQIGSKVIDTSLSGQLKEISYFLEAGP